MKVQPFIRECAVQSKVPELAPSDIALPPDSPALSGQLRRSGAQSQTTGADFRIPVIRLARAAAYLQIPEATLRDLRFYSEDRKSADGHVVPGNGFARSFLKLGRAVYVDVPVFVEIWRAQQSQGVNHG